MPWPHWGKRKIFTACPSFVSYQNKLNYVFFTVSVSCESHWARCGAWWCVRKTSARHNSSMIWIVTGQVMTWCGGLTMSWCPKFTAGGLARRARWEVGVITCPWALNSAVISFHLQMHRRSKPDQIEERRSVGSVGPGEHTWRWSDRL